MKNATNFLIDRIDERLTALGISAQAASKQIPGRAKDYIQTIRRGKSKSPRGESLVLLAKVLECPVEYLMFEHETPTVSTWKAQSAATNADGVRSALPPPSMDLIERSLRYLHELCVAAGIAQRVPSDAFAEGFRRHIEYLCSVDPDTSDETLIAPSAGQIVTNLIHATNEAEKHPADSVEPLSLKRV